MLSAASARSRLPNLLKVDPHGRHLLRGAIWTFGSKLVTAGAGFLLNILLARQMGIEEFGLFSYVLSLTLLLATLSCFGLNQAAIRFVAAYVIQEKWSLLRGFVHGSQLFAFVLSAIVATALGMYASSVALPVNERRTLLIGSATVLISSMIIVQAGFLRGLKRVSFAELVENGGLRSLLALVLLAVLLASGRHFDAAPQGMVLILLSTGMALVGTIVVLGRTLPPQMSGCASVYHATEWLTTALPMFLIAGAVLAQSQVNILMLRHLASIEDVGIFAATARLAILVGFGLSAANAALAPAIAEMYAVGRLKDLQRIIYQTSLLTSAAALCLCVAGIVGGAFALDLFGPGFESGYPALLILLAAEGFNALAGSTGYLMTLTGLQRPASVIVIVTVIVNVALNAVLIPAYGMAGAATSTLVSTVGWNTAMLLFLYVKADIRSTPLLIVIDFLRKLRSSQ